MQSTIVVIPCFNEAARLPSERFIAAAGADPGCSFVMVDDGSRDQTQDVLLSLADRCPGKFIVLSLERNQGKAEAVRRGMNRAFERRPDFVGYFDADLATPLEELVPMRRLLIERPELQMVLGSRVALLGREVTRSHGRHYLGRVFASVASLSLGLTVYDTQCGAKLFRNSDAVRTAFAEPFGSRWTFDVELLARLNALAAEGALPPLTISAAEHPLHQWRDVSGSKLRAGAAIGATVELARIWRRYAHGWKR
jgi:glycosyltransferase involved in cell wall biosynthesis